MNKNEVTVVVPFYNRSGFLNRLLDSVLAQSYRVDLIFVIDNGSTLEESNRAWNIICDHEMREKCVFISTLKFGNANIARNLGFFLAETEYVAFLDSDDWWGQNHIRNSIDLLRISNKAGVYSGAYIIRQSGQSTHRSSNVDDFRSPISFLFGGGGMAQSSSFVVNKPKVSGKAYWDEELKRSQDHDYFICLQERTSGWIYNSIPGYYIDWRSGGATGSVDSQSILRFFYKWEHLFNQNERKRFFVKYMVVCRKRDMAKDFRMFQRTYRLIFGSTIYRRLVSSSLVISGFSFIIDFKQKFNVLRYRRKLRNNM